MTVDIGIPLHTLPAARSGDITRVRVIRGRWNVSVLTRFRELRAETNNASMKTVVKLPRYDLTITHSTGCNLIDIFDGVGGLPVAAYSVLTAAGHALVQHCSAYAPAKRSGSPLAVRSGGKIAFTRRT